MDLNPARTDIDYLSDRVQTLRPASHYALAVSGGGDSMGALALIAAWAKRPKAPHFTVLTVDHGLRPEARKEAAMVAETCAKLGLTHHVLTADRVLGETDVQQQARLLRYRLMAAFCQADKLPLITAHHRQDQAETVAMRLARGSGVDGLAGMASRRWLETEAGHILVLRPFLDVSPHVLTQARKAMDLPHSDDPSNYDRRFERVRWRDKMPAMEEAGLSEAALIGLAADMQALQKTRDDSLYEWLERQGHWHDYGVLRLPRDAWRVLSLQWRERLVSQCVRHFGRHHHPPKRDAVRGLIRQIDTTPSGAAVLGGVMLRWRKREVFFGRECAALAAQGRFGGQTAVWDGRFRVTKLPHGHFVAPLGEKGVAILRAQGAVFDKTVPSAYHAVLPALFEAGIGDEARLIGLATENAMARVSFKNLCDALFDRGADW